MMNILYQLKVHFVFPLYWSVSVSFFCTLHASWLQEVNKAEAFYLTSSIQQLGFTPTVCHCHRRQAHWQVRCWCQHSVPSAAAPRYKYVKHSTILQLHRGARWWRGEAAAAVWDGRACRFVCNTPECVCGTCVSSSQWDEEGNIFTETSVSPNQPKLRYGHDQMQLWSR